MKILFCERNALMQRDMEEAFHNLGIFFRCASYVFSNPDHDDYYQSHLHDFLTEDRYDAVFSFNFIPVIAEVCHEMDIPYISWGYDAGFEFRERTALFYETNFIFHFDKKACDEYKKAGYKNIFHMPLAVNCHRLDAISTTPEQCSKYRSDVAFLGSLYERFLSENPPVFDYLDPADVAALVSFCDQASLDLVNPGLWNNITDELTAAIKSRQHFSYDLKRLTLIAATASMIAGRQRKLMLDTIASRFPLALYTTSDPALIPDADFRWRASYYSEMPLVFKNAIINLNLTIPSIQAGLPLRFFDILGAGGFLLTNEQEEIGDYFKIGTDLETFHDIEELMGKISFYLSHPDTAARIAKNGHDVVKEEFSFERQFMRILETCKL